MGTGSAAAASSAAGGVCALSDVQLQLPLREGATRLINGFGYKGAPRPREVLFRWDDPVDHAQRGLNCRVWLGSADAGLQLNLQGVLGDAAAPFMEQLWTWLLEEQGRVALAPRWRPHGYTRPWRRPPPRSLRSSPRAFLG